MHLFGSIHVGRPDFYPLPKKVEESFRKSDTLVLEIDPRSDAFVRAAQSMLTEALLPPPQDLRGQISDSLFQVLNRKMELLALPLENFSQFKPWFLALTLSQVQLAVLGFKAEHGVEIYFLGKRGSMPVLELETAESQLKVLADSIDGEDFLAYTLLTLDSIPQKLDALIEAWKRGDDRGVREILFNEKDPRARHFDTIDQQLIINRNIRMAAKIMEFLERGRDNYFVAVGTGHFIGDQSIVKLLEGAGYKVER